MLDGVTRAGKLVVLAGSRRAVTATVRNRDAGRRHTALIYRLHKAGDGLTDRGQS